MSTISIDSLIRNKAEKLYAVSEQIWEFAELRFSEKRSAALLANVLEEEGFDVQRGIAGIETAFVANFGTGKPVISFLGEFDALSDLSQEAGVTEQQAIVSGGAGHGCGHNLLGTSALGAALAVKEYMQENGLSGTVRYYGCPGEEGGSGKTFMAKEGVFDDADAAITWHPFTHSGVQRAETLANYQVYFKFKGKSAHAAGGPHLGRSALDAVELMNIGTNFLREHVVQDARLHYAITNAGGVSPNVVQPEAEVLYLVRAPETEQVESIYQRVVKIAKGAALMTETELEITFDKACSGFIRNTILEQVMQEQVERVPVPKYSAEELDFARGIQTTLSEEDISSDKRTILQLIGKDAALWEEEMETSPILTTPIPYHDTENFQYGSTDVGDVSRITPTIQFHAACFAIGTPLHTWQVVSQGKTSLAQKGMLYASEVMAATALTLFDKPEQLEAAKLELQKRLGPDGYTSPIPEGVKPTILA
ncbi:amidohydrolase [Terribacillus saccharophilus]|uniref:Amidohydrolase n=1 Tax=Terribacillus saccharophilus TaxID=361277 RepID=A0A268HDY4_9BACI|nr:M20 family metallopeptidase [Terribacillus saccharophilus]PAE08084.1 amidohydrolase [Terribacillus saccharophilus]